MTDCLFYIYVQSDIFYIKPMIIKLSEFTDIVYTVISTENDIVHTVLTIKIIILPSIISFSLLNFITIVPHLK